MKVAVTGATGFVGAALVAALQARGDSIVALSRDAGRARAVLGDVTAVAADLQSRGAWMAAIAGCDAVVNLAGESLAGKRWDARQKQLIRDSRVEATAALVEAITAAPAAARPKLLISASGVDYYPSAAGLALDDDEVTEADPPGESFLARLCRDWEAEARAAEAAGVRVVCMRTGIVLGHGGALARLVPVFKAFAGGRVGSGRQWMAWVHRDDVVRAYLATLIDERFAGPINLVTDSVRNAELAHALGRALHRPSFFPTPGLALRLALGEFADYLLAGRRVVPTRLRSLGFTWQRPTLETALTAIV